MTLSRRRLLKLALPACVLAAARREVLLGEATALPPVRTITHGPKHHWFGYYDKLQFDPAVRFCLGNQVDFEHRSPSAADRIGVGLVDLEDNDRWIPLGSSGAWGWQQGCMLQWIPESNRKVIYNDRQGDHFVARVVDTASGETAVLPHAVYSLSPAGRYAVSTDFRRINDLRPGYGYAGLPDPWADRSAPAEIGILRIDLESGTTRMLVSLEDIVRIPFRGGGFGSGKHWFNHLLVSPDGRRTIFLHRWRTQPNRWSTRMFTVGLDGGDLREINPGAGMVSHFIWRDPNHILAWTTHASAGDAFYLLEDREGGNVTPIGADVLERDGHCLYLPGEDWILSDTYPQGPDRMQEVYLYHIAQGRRVSLGKFHSPPEYAGEWRCDTHPRFSPDKHWVCIDSPHGGKGRQMHLIDIRGIMDRAWE